jgi:hypothetical protein
MGIRYEVASGIEWLDVKLTIHLHLVLRLRICGAIPPFTLVSS